MRYRGVVVTAVLVMATAVVPAAEAESVDALDRVDLAGAPAEFGVPGTPVPAGDLDGDGAADLVAQELSETGTVVTALRGRDATPLWRFASPLIGVAVPARPATGPGCCSPVLNRMERAGFGWR